MGIGTVTSVSRISLHLFIFCLHAYRTRLRQFSAALSMMFWSMSCQMCIKKTSVCQCYAPGKVIDSLLDDALYIVLDRTEVGLFDSHRSGRM